MKRALLLLLLVGCTKKDPPIVEPPEASAPSTPVLIDATDIAKNACGSCHTMQMLEQQRLTEAQWTKVVTKMVSWGANLEPSDQPVLIAWLSGRFGLDAGAYAPGDVGMTELTAAIVPTADGVYANGDETRGKASFVDKCSGCHDQNARGHIGVNLVDRPFLYRADDFAGTIRKGRGKMPAQKVTDPEVADMLAYLRTLR